LAEKITTVFFDFGGTLCDYYPSNAEIWSKIAARLGYQIPPDDSRIHQGMKNMTQAYQRLDISFGQLTANQLHTLNCQVLNAMGIDGSGTQDTIAAEFLAREKAGLYTLYPDIPQTLHALKQKGIKMGLISNVGQELAITRRPFLKENGILHFFDTIIFSVEVGVVKPEKAIFDLALREIGEGNPSSTMHVGDSPIEDVKGARNAGLIPILFDSLDFFSTENVIKIKALSDILQYLK
jgi:HAD superfamily hydrolase (TIGR01549 family)